MKKGDSVIYLCRKLFGYSCVFEDFFGYLFIELVLFYIKF